MYCIKFSEMQKKKKIYLVRKYRLETAIWIFYCCHSEDKQGLKLVGD